MPPIARYCKTFQADLLLQLQLFFSDESVDDGGLPLEQSY